MRSRLSFIVKSIIAVVAILAIVAMLPSVLDAKFWGVVLFGSSVVILGAMPWLDHSPVRSIRYRPRWHLYLLCMLALVFLTLGFLGTRSTTASAGRN